MRDNWIPDTPELFAEYLAKLRQKREKTKSHLKETRRKSNNLSSIDRERISKKTAHRCHICGGLIDGKWEADHVLARSGGGQRNADNFLPAHKICNNYRWDYLSEEFQEILRLGVWLRTQIEKKTKIGTLAAEQFIKYEKGRIARKRKM